MFRHRANENPLLYALQLLVHSSIVVQKCLHATVKCLHRHSVHEEKQRYVYFVYMDEQGIFIKIP